MADGWRARRRSTRVATAVATAAMALVAGGGIAQAGLTTSWLTYHHDPARTGFDNGEPSFWSMQPAWSSFPSVDGTMDAQPLVYGSEVIVATENDSMYGFDIDSGAQLWTVSLGTARHSQPFCNPVFPQGITSTPVIDGSDLYAVADDEDDTTNPPTYSFVMAKYDLSSSPPTQVYKNDITPALMRSDPVTHSDVTVNQKQRTALAISNGNIVVGWGGLSGDCNQYHGYVETVSESSGTPQAEWVSSTETNGRESAVWEPSGPAVDSSGNIFVATGNGNAGTSENPNAPYDCSDAVLRFSPSLSLTSLFVPSNWQSLDQNDGDLGSTGPLLLSNGLLFQIGKSGQGVLLNQSLPDSVAQPPPNQQTYCPANPALGGAGASAQVCPASTDATFGATAVMGSMVYIGCSDGVHAINIDSPTAFHTVWSWAAANGNPSDIIDGVPTVAGGLVWAGGLSGDSTLCGLDPSTGVDRACVQLPMVTAHFATPVAADGELFIADGTRVAAYVPPPVAAAPAGGGYVIDGYGGLHTFGGSSKASTYGYWPPTDVVRAAVLRPDRKGGLAVLGNGTLDAFGMQTPVTGATLPFDIARGIALDPCDSSGGSGYILDGYGGIHPFGNAPAVSAKDYLPGLDIARSIVVNPCTGGALTGYYLDGYGGIHAFWQRSTTPVNPPADSVYWPGWDIARSFVLTGTSSGQMLDGWGGIHSFGGAPAAAGSAWHPGSDSSRVIANVSGTQGGDVLDSGGAISTWWVKGTTAPSAPAGVTTFGFPIARGLAS